MRKFMVFLFLLAAHHVSAAVVDTVSLHSRSLGDSSRAIVILPDAYNHERIQAFPVVYLLHGYGGDYTNWIRRVPALAAHADRYQMIIVCPDGKNSWYINSPAGRYEDYISGELIPFIDKTYRTKKVRSQRAITGLSMGGHGALYLARKHPDLFSAAGSMSGVLNLLPWKGSYGLSTVIKDTSTAAVSAYSNMQLFTEQDTTLQLIIDCGIADVFIESNRAMHQRLLELKISHDYTERPGGHSWQYWSNAVEYHLLFFRKIFDAADMQPTGEMNAKDSANSSNFPAVATQTSTAYPMQGP